MKKKWLQSMIQWAVCAILLVAALAVVLHSPGCGAEKVFIPKDVVEHAAQVAMKTGGVEVGVGAGVIEVGPLEEDLIASCPPSVSVTCGSGYYACCWLTYEGCGRARCRKAGTSDGQCIGGGEGATECEIDRDVEDEESLEEIY